MKNFKNNCLALLLTLFVSCVYSQGKVTGTVNDAELNAGLPGVSILVKGTSDGTTTDSDGKFSINVKTNSGQLIITYIGFQSQTLSFSVGNNGTVDLGTIQLITESNQLDEIVIKSSVIDIAKDRKTPVAVSTIKAAEIQQKLGNQEFPEILANTPSVYATKSGGGFGDSRITIRGFAQENIAVMINGVPINDMENGRVFWSNWAGLSDVTSAMQVQRGLGSSKLAISSVGGTINVVTRAADMKEGGVVSVGTANDNYLKTQVSYSTGKMKNGLSASVLLSQTRGQGYVDGTKFSEGNYFIALGYEFNKKHDIQFTFTGAPQWHNQRSTAPTLNQYLKYGSDGEPNIRYNSDWGYLNGGEYSFRTNYYHKPVASLNWDWKINEAMKLSTIVYGSWGRGGGTNGAGAIRGNRFFADNLRKPDGSINVDLINDYNSGLPVTIAGQNYTRSQIGGFYQNSASTSNNATNGISQISSINSHNWYGGVVNLNSKLTSNLTLDFGIDARAYRGIHYQVLTDLLGAGNYNANYDPTGATSNDINNQTRTLYYTYAALPNGNPFFNTDYQQKINYNNDGDVRWYGAFTQLEYTSEKLTAFIQGAVSQQGFKRVDYFKYLSTDKLSSTDYENILGGNVKGGANYNINSHHNVFVNAGYYSKQPFFNAVYPNNASLVNGNLVNEKIIGFEAGYGFRSKVFSANLNAYHTTWQDRYQRSNDAALDNPGGYYDFSGVKEVHTGVELDMNARVTDKFKVNGMVSVGNWEYKGNSKSNRYDATNNPISGGTDTTLYLDGVKVGDAAQTTASIGGSYEVVKRLSVDANYRYTDKLFAAISPGNFTQENNLGSLQLPSFGLMDAGLSYQMLVGKDKSNSVNFRLNVNNVLDKIYIAESRTNQFTATEAEFTGNTGNGAGLFSNLPVTPEGKYSSYQDYQNRGVYNGVDTRNQVFFGFGRTWNFTISYNF